MAIAHAAVPINVSQSVSVVGLPESTPTLNAGSLIVIRTNGNRDRIGNVYRPMDEAFGCAVSAFQFLSQATHPLDRDFLSGRFVSHQCRSACPKPLQVPRVSET
jgi:hypothetical protein